MGLRGIEIIAAEREIAEGSKRIRLTKPPADLD
jgi:hypothetical protein